MNAVRTTAGRGWGWIVEGWRLFVKAPVIWIVITLIYTAIAFGLSLVPFVGTLANALLSPVLWGGLLFGAAALARGEPLQVSHLFQGFKDQERLGPLVVLGLISLAAGVVMALVLFLFMGGGLLLGGALDHAGTVVPPQSMGSLFAGLGLMTLLIILSISLLVGMAMFYGVPLVMLGGQYAWPAVQDSIAASWINILPLLVFGLISLVLGIAAIIPLGLGLLVLVPVLVGAVYASYREVFEERTAQRVNLAK